VSLFSGKRRSRSRGGFGDRTPSAPRTRPLGEPIRIEPDVTAEWTEGWSSGWSEDWAEDWAAELDSRDGDSWAATVDDHGDDHGDDDRGDDDRGDDAGSWRGGVIDHDGDVALRRRVAATAKVLDDRIEPGVLAPDEAFPMLPLPAAFRPIRNSVSPQRHLFGAGRFPDTSIVDEAPTRSVVRPYRLDPFMFDPSSILVGQLGWYIDTVDVGAASGFEALVFGVRGRPGIGAQLIVPSAVDGWTFDSALSSLTEVQTRSEGNCDTAVGFDRDGNTLCVSLLQHVDVYAVRLKGTSQFAVAVEVADRYAQVVDDEL
jgi:hypothetical protein